MLTAFVGSFAKALRHRIRLSGNRNINRNVIGFSVLALISSGGTYANDAILIGVDAYQSSPLSNPLNDITLLRETLHASGWQVSEVRNPTASELRQSLDTFFDIHRNSDSPVLVYFAGHGFQYRGENYLVPADVAIGDVESLIQASISVTELAYLSRNIGGAKIFVIDACRDDAGLSSGTSISSSLNSQTAPPNSLIAYSTAPGTYASDGQPGTNSPYASALSASFLKGGEIDEVFRATRVETMRVTETRQVPWESSSLLYTFPVNLSDIEDDRPIYEDFPQYSIPVVGSLPGTQEIPDADDFVGVLNELSQLIRVADIRSFENWESRPSTERDRSDYIATIEQTIENYHPLSSGLTYIVLRALQSGSFNPSCRDGDGIDSSCGDYDRWFKFVPNFSLSLKLARFASDENIENSHLARHYENGWLVDVDLLQAYDLYIKDKDLGGEYYWADINQMAQRYLVKRGYSLEIDGDFGPSSCSALREVIGQTNCERVVTREQIEALMRAAT